jgi:hypothetical protein
MSQVIELVRVAPLPKLLPKGVRPPDFGRDRQRPAILKIPINIGFLRLQETAGNFASEISRLEP